MTGRLLNRDRSSEDVEGEAVFAETRRARSTRGAARTRAARSAARADVVDSVRTPGPRCTGSRAGTMTPRCPRVGNALNAYTRSFDGLALPVEVVTIG